MRLYVAGKFEEAVRVRCVQDALKALGHEITHDWTREEDVSHLSGAPLRAAHARFADACLTGVLEAEALILLLHPQGQGSFVELGAALAHEIPVHIVDCAAPVASVFVHADGVRRYASEQKLIEDWITDLEVRAFVDSETHDTPAAIWAMLSGRS